MPLIERGSSRMASVIIAIASSPCASPVPVTMSVSRCARFWRTLCQGCLDFTGPLVSLVRLGR